jgi:phage baseplate assembly protein W
MAEENSFLGKGWSFPPRFDSRTGELIMSVEEQDIQESLHILLTTRVGERIIQPDYGCDLTDFIFESLNTTNKTYIRDLVETAVLYYEPRIDIERLDFDVNDNEGVVNMHLQYVIRSTNSRSNIVFPFYKNEASNS